MTIDRMDARVDVAPGAAKGGGGIVPASATGSPHAAPPQSLTEVMEALRPIVTQIVEGEFETMLRIAGLR